MIWKQLRQQFVPLACDAVIGADGEELDSAPLKTVCDELFVEVDRRVSLKLRLGCRPPLTALSVRVRVTKRKIGREIGDAGSECVFKLELEGSLILFVHPELPC